MAAEAEPGPRPGAPMRMVATSMRSRRRCSTMEVEQPKAQPMVVARTYQHWQLLKRSKLSAQSSIAAQYRHAAAAPHRRSETVPCYSVSPSKLVQGGVARELRGWADMKEYARAKEAEREWRAAMAPTTQVAAGRREYVPLVVLTDKMALRELKAQACAW